VSFAGDPGERFECAIDDAAFSSCTSPVGISRLTVGAHVLLVRALDPAGNVGDPLRVRWLIDPDAGRGGPARSMTLRAPRRVPLRAGSFEVGCVLDAGALDRCSVVARVRLRGRHLFIGSGLAAPSGGRRSGAARVHLSDAGRRRLRRAGAGAVIVLGGRAVQEGSSAILRDVATVRAQRVRRRGLPAAGLRR
jgi:hypothetical protein